MPEKNYQIPNDVKQQFLDCIKISKNIAIAGHTHPDGDSIGSCLALCGYIMENYPTIHVDVLLEPIPKQFAFLEKADRITQEEAESYDLFISLDCSDTKRLTDHAHLVEDADYSICVDHHVTNTGFAKLNIIEPEASSCAEIVYQLLEDQKINKACAEALYMGIVHDTGVFKHSNTTRKTMEIAGMLLEKGVNSSYIIDDTFYKKTYKQNQILGRALLESILVLDGRMIFSFISRKDFKNFEIEPSDLDGVIDQLRVTEGVEVAVLLYTLEDGSCKASLRSNGIVNVSKIAMEFGGGGHEKAAGFSDTARHRDIVMNIARRVEEQLNGVEEA